MPFEVGEEVMFRPKANEMIEGIVVDVGWYRSVGRGKQGCTEETCALCRADGGRYLHTQMRFAATVWRYQGACLLSGMENMLNIESFCCTGR